MRWNSTSSEGSRGRRVALWVALCCAAVLASSAAYDVFAAGKKGARAWSVTLDDLAGDAILSDGAGPFAGTYNSRELSITVKTNDRALYFDFSDSEEADPVTPFGPGVLSGEIADVTMTLSAGMVWFEFTGWDGTTRWALELYDVSGSWVDTDGDGSADTFAVRTIDDNSTTPGSALWYWDGGSHQGRQRRGANLGGWVSAGRFTMPAGFAGVSN